MGVMMFFNCGHLALDGVRGRGSVRALHSNPLGTEGRPLRPYLFEGPFKFKKLKMIAMDQPVSRNVLDQQ